MKGMALETVVQWIILIVVAGVVLNLIFFFSDDIKRIIGGFTKGNEPKPIEVEADKFSTSQVKTYMRACWDKTGERFQEDMICYLLRGDVSGVDPKSLADIGYNVTVDTSKFIRTQKVTIIRFQDVGNKIIVES
jgi:hypothetical protein